ncbi:hypothetical protein ACWWIX_001503, partial [Cronobacter sakazakii]
KKEPVHEYGLFCFYIAPGKRQVRSAYLPYKTFRRVGKRKRTHHSPALAGALRLPALQNCHKRFRRVGKRKRTHLPAAKKPQR